MFYKGKVQCLYTKIILPQYLCFKAGSCKLSCINGFTFYVFFIIIISAL